MVDSVGGDLPPPPMDPVLDSAMLTLSVTSSPSPTVDPPAGPTMIQLDGSSSESSLATPVVSDPIPNMSQNLLLLTRISQAGKTSSAPLPLKLKGPALVEGPVPNVPPIHQDPIVGLVVTPTPGLDLPPPTVEDPVMEEYPFAESIINLLKSPTKHVDEASKSALKEQCISLTANSVSLVDQLEDGEIASDPTLAPKTARSPMVFPTPNQGILSPGALANFGDVHKRRRNHISSLLDDNNQEVNDEDSLSRLTTNYFATLFREDGDSRAPVGEDLLNCLPPPLSVEDNSLILAPVSEEEVKSVVFAMGSC
ncbi:hypothetical protein SUGI_0520600 [Cryptomeria japonica]|nr:hypothetical protein SUGI_0520600 [Cryptomeria japonica]